MTIILQHQFWDLVVTEDRFEVGLSFGGIPERLVVPFAAIKSFLDPSVQFGLQFEPSEAAVEPSASKAAGSSPLRRPPCPVAAPEPAAESADEPAKAGRRRRSGAARSFPQEIIREIIQAQDHRRRIVELTFRPFTA